MNGGIVINKRASKVGGRNGVFSIGSATSTRISRTQCMLLTLMCSGVSRGGETKKICLHPEYVAKVLQ